MPEDYFNLILTQSKSNFKQINNPPKVVYNPKKKTVSVKYDFALGLIEKVKIIAPCSVWLDLWRRRETEHISFEVLAPCLYRLSKEKKKALILYSKNYPGSFSADVLDCVKWSHTKNPLIIHSVISNCVFAI
ncbi:MAG: hypothetical protein JSW26_01175 [Desulfobacterales bacterium]|nr:MAG: hypothetical protein JSW26_01175 [Desulfobacterales bacterium]